MQGFPCELAAAVVRRSIAGGSHRLSIRFDTSVWPMLLALAFLLYRCVRDETRRSGTASVAGQPTIRTSLSRGNFAFRHQGNSEVNLPACLASLDWCDDIVVLDSFST